MGNCSEGCCRCVPDDVEIRGNLRELISVRHPNLQKKDFNTEEEYYAVAVIPASHFPSPQKVCLLMTCRRLQPHSFEFERSHIHGGRISQLSL